MGLILLAAAPCTAMVLVWSKLTDGDPCFSLSPVALNALLLTLVLLFAFQGEAIIEQVLIEVPAMLLVVRVMNRSRGWYEGGRG